MPAMRKAEKDMRSFLASRKEIKKGRIMTLLRQNRLTPSNIKDRIQRMEKARLSGEEISRSIDESMPVLDYRMWRSRVKKGLPIKEPSLETQRLEESVQEVHDYLSDVDCTREQAELLVLTRHFDLDKVIGRRGRLQDAGAPVNVSNIGRGAPNLQRYLDRFAIRHGMTLLQQEVYDFLVGKEVSHETALELARRPKGNQYSLKDMKAKVAHLESIELDPEMYGVERIPPWAYENILHRPMYYLKEGKINRNVLWPLEDAYKERLLDGEVEGKEGWPEWRQHSVLTNPKKKGKYVYKTRPAKLYANLLACGEADIEPTADILANSSAESIRSGAAKPMPSKQPKSGEVTYQERTKRRRRSTAKPRKPRMEEFFSKLIRTQGGNPKGIGRVMMAARLEKSGTEFPSLGKSNRRGDFIDLHVTYLDGKLHLEVKGMDWGREHELSTLPRDLRVLKDGRVVFPGGAVIRPTSATYTSRAKLEEKTERF